MSDKKNIDRLFQERFKDFETVPDDKIWSKIHDALHEKKKKKVIPLWWKFSGIAAGFILAFFAFNTLSKTFIDEPAVVNGPKEIEKVNKNRLNSAGSSEINIVVVENNDSSAIENKLNENRSKLNPTSTTEAKVVVENSNSSVNEIISKTNETNSNQNSQNKNTIVNNGSSKKAKSKTTENTSLAKNTNSKNKLELIETNTILEKQVASNSSIEKLINQNEIANKENKTSTTLVVLPTENNLSIKNKVLKDTDSTALALKTETNPLEEILKKKNEKEEVLAIEKLSRWQVTTNVAPIYFNSASNGSPIESQFAENSKSYENNLSVGVGVQYAINKKLAVRTGINKVKLGYGTNDVVFFGGLNSPGFSTLSSSNTISKIEVISANNTLGLRPFEENMDNLERGVLNQTMGYYEVPLELSYALINRKFGVQIIGGLSTMFLNENSVSVQSANTTMSLGKANNLNDVHFSSNIGLGIKYEFWKSFEAHFEPTLKYQFNTFSRDSGNFKPYFVGLYTGISFKF